MKTETPIAVGDILIVLDTTRRKKLSGEVQLCNRGNLTIESVDAYGTTETHDLRLEDLKVLANLGPTPLPGSVYGQTIRKLYSSTTHDFWGNICIMRNMADDEKDALKVAMQASAKKLKTLGLYKRIELTGFVVGEAKGRYAGMYRFGKLGNHIFLTPRELDSSQAGYILDHEVAHAIWFQCLGDDAKASWVHLFSKFTRVLQLTDDNLEQVIDILCSSRCSIESYYEQVADIEDGVYLLDALLDSLRAIHLMDTDDLSLYLWSIKNSKRRDELERATLNLTPLYGEHTDYPVSEYGTKNTAELFAEAYSHYCNGMSMHKDAVALLELTLPSIKNIPRKV